MQSQFGRSKGRSQWNRMSLMRVAPEGGVGAVEKEQKGGDEGSQHSAESQMSPHLRDVLLLPFVHFLARYLYYEPDGAYQVDKSSLKSDSGCG